MNLQCEDGFLFHLWGSTGSCLRCGISAGIDLYLDLLDQGRVADETSVDDQSELALRELVRLVDHPDLREDDLFPSAAASADASAATSRADWGVPLLPLQAVVTFLRRYLNRA